MTTSVSPLPVTEFDDTLNRLASWPPHLRVALARQLLESVDPTLEFEAPIVADALPARARVQQLLGNLPMPRVSKPALTLPMDQVVGIARPDGPVPNDDDCERILESEMMRKYG
jgi:hypothetical protein